MKTVPDSPLLSCECKTIGQDNFIIDCPTKDIAVQLIEQIRQIESMLSIFPQLRNFRIRVGGKDYSGIYTLKRTSGR